MKYIKYAILLTAAVLTFSCVDNPSGLFYSLQYESQLSTAELDEGLTVGDMALRNNYYFIASGSFRFRAADDTLWSDGNRWSDSIPDNITGYSCYKMINLDELYVIFFNSDTLDYRLFAAGTSAVSTDVITWTEIVISAIPTDESLIDLAQSNGRVFLYTEKTVTGGAAGEDKRYSVYSVAGTSLAAGTVLTSELSTLDSYGELDVDYDGTNYWLISGNQLYTGTTGALVEDTEAAATSDEILGDGYGGLICYDHDDNTATDSDVYLSTDEGVLLKYTGGAWTDLTDAASLNRIYDFKHIEIPDEGINILLLGSELGYYEIDLESTSPTFVSPEDADTKLTSTVAFASIELSNDVIRDFFFDTANNTIFALGYKAGLWQNSIDSDSRAWDIE